MPKGIYEHKKLPLEIRFWGNVDISEGCWLWMGLVNAQGYGRIKIDGHVELAHRVAYELASGIKVSRDVDICHTCDNPPCCRPDHLFAGTAKDNMLDSVRKGRKHRFEKLTANRIREIRMSEGISQTELAEQYNVSNSTISVIRSGKRYPWV